MGTMNFSVAAGLFEGSLAALAVSLGWFLGRSPTDTFHFNTVDFLWGVVATLPLLGMLWISAKAPFGPFKRMMAKMDDTFIPLFRQSRMVELAIISLLAGLGEEMLFRGIIQAWATDIIGGPFGIGIGLCAAAVIFGLLHAVTPTYSLLAGAICIYMGAIWLPTNNLLVPITTHALYDFLAFVYYLLFRAPKPVSNLGDNGPENHAE
jgi:uncharacterized protein